MPDTINAGTALRELNKLYNALPKSDDKDKIFQQIKDLTKQIKILRDNVINNSIEEYTVATKSMEEANKAIADAQKNLGKVAETVAIVAKGIDGLGKLLKAIGLGV